MQMVDRCWVPPCFCYSLEENAVLWAEGQGVSRKCGGKGGASPTKNMRFVPHASLFFSQQNEKHVRGGAGGQGFTGCFIADDIKHFYFKFSVVLISSLLLLLFS